MRDDIGCQDIRVLILISNPDFRFGTFPAHYQSGCLSTDILSGRPGRTKGTPTE